MQKKDFWNNLVYWGAKTIFGSDTDMNLKL